VHHTLPINDAFYIEDILNDANMAAKKDKTPLKYQFKIVNAEKSFVVYTDTEPDKKEWFQKLSDQIGKVTHYFDVAYYELKNQYGIGLYSMLIVVSRIRQVHLW
jgi:hypothetical protein